MLEHVSSYYAATANFDRPYPQLGDSLRADVCVIGGGYTGVSAALNLAERGYKVVLLETARIGWGASGRNGGELFNGMRKSPEDLETLVGKEQARRLWDFGLEAVEQVCERVQRHNIACDLKPGIVVAAAKPAHAGDLKRRAAKLQEEYGYDKVRYLEREEVREMIGTARFHGGDLDTGCWHLHPLNLVQGLAAAATRAGAELFEQSRVLSYAQAQPAMVRTERGEVQADFVVLACDAYLEGLEPRIESRVLPIHNFMLATEPLSEVAAKSLLPDDVAVADTKFVVNYWRLSGDRRLLFGGGENYSTRYPADIRRFVRRFMLKVYPRLAGIRIDYGWGGTVGVTMKRLPHLGRLGPNVYFAQGYSGQGIALSNFAGKLLAEVISGTAERFDVLASLPVPAFPGGTLLRQPAMVLGMLYYSLLDRL